MQFFRQTIFTPSRRYGHRTCNRLCPAPIPHQEDNARGNRDTRKACNQRVDKGATNHDAEVRSKAEARPMRRKFQDVQTVEPGKSSPMIPRCPAAESVSRRVSEILPGNPRIEGKANRHSDASSLPRLHG